MRSVAERALRTQREGNEVVIIVSAMAGETNRLLGLAHEISATPDMREMDALASTGAPDVGHPVGDVGRGLPAEAIRRRPHDLRAMARFDQRSLERARDDEVAAFDQRRRRCDDEDESHGR